MLTTKSPHGQDPQPQDEPNRRLHSQGIQQSTEHSRPVASKVDCDVPISRLLIERHQNRLFVFSIVDEIVNEKLVNQHTYQDEFKQYEDMHFGIPLLKLEFIETWMLPLRQREKTMNRNVEADRKNLGATSQPSTRVLWLLTRAEGVPPMP